MCRCIYSYWEADTGSDKAHEYSWAGKAREGPLANTMGFRASGSGMGRTNPWLQEKAEIAEAMEKKKEEEEQKKAGSPSHQQERAPKIQAPEFEPEPRGTVAEAMKRSPSPNKMWSSKWTPSSSSSSQWKPKKKKSSGPGESGSRKAGAHGTAGGGSEASTRPHAKA